MSHNRISDLLEASNMNTMSKNTQFANGGHRKPSFKPLPAELEGSPVSSSASSMLIPSPPESTAECGDACRHNSYIADHVATQEDRIRVLERDIAALRVTIELQSKYFSERIANLAAALQVNTAKQGDTNAAEQVETYTPEKYRDMVQEQAPWMINELASLPEQETYTVGKDPNRCKFGQPGPGKVLNRRHGDDPGRKLCYQHKQDGFEIWRPQKANDGKSSWECGKGKLI